MTFTKRYHEILRVAERLASCESATCVHTRHIFWACIGVGGKKIFNTLLGRRKLVMQDVMRLNGDAKIQTERQDIPFSSEVWRMLSLHGGELGRVMSETEQSKVDVAHVAAALVLADGSLKELLSVNGVDAHHERDGILERVKRLATDGKRDTGREVARKVAGLRAALLERLVGQECAINQVCDVLYSAWLNPPPKFGAPSSIFVTGTFGTETEFALALSEEICKVRDIAAKPLVLNASLFASDKDATDVSGRDPSWKSPQASVLRPVDAEPKMPVVVTNAELLHNCCRPLFLEASKGRLKDQFDGKEIDFSKSVFIFCSAAGSSALDNAGAEFQNGIISRERLSERLSSEIVHPDHAMAIKALIGECTVSVALKPLYPVELRELAYREIDKEIKRLGSFCRKVEVDRDGLATLTVEALSSLDPRAVTAIVARFTEPFRTQRYMCGAVGRLNNIKIAVTGVSPFDPDRVVRILAERKHLYFSVDCSIDGLAKECSITIATKGYVCLPALRDGIILIDTPKDTDTFDKLVGISKPKAFCGKWLSYFNGETDVRPSGLLLAGPPGTGKTSFCRAIAHELKRPYCIISSRDLGSPEAIINVFATIRRYSQSGLVVIIDEIDGIASDRNGKNEAYCERLGMVLSGMDGMDRDNASRVLYIGATNRPEAIDGALTRPGRLGMTVFFTPLTLLERRKLVEMSAAECRISLGKRLVDFAVRISEGMPPAEIKATIQELATLDNVLINERAILKARSAIKNGIVTQPTNITEEERASTATHEAAHCIVAEALGRRYVAVSIESSSACLGYFEQQDSGLDASTQQGLLDTMAISLAGRAGQEIIYGKTTDGAISDIEKATNIAKRYIMSGWDESWGLGVPEDVEWKDVAPIVRPLLAQQYKVAKDILESERTWLVRLSKLLLEEEIVFQDEVRALRQDCRKDNERCR